MNKSFRHILTGSIVLASLSACTMATYAQTNDIKIEIFIDGDKGVGSGSMFDGSDGSNTLEMPTTGINTGAHIISFRASDADGKWSHTITRVLYVYEESQGFDGAEYFIDEDPGAGNGNTLSVGDGSSIMFMIGTGNLSVGTHTLSVRLRSGATWGEAMTKAFIVTPNSLGFEWFYDDDPGMGKGNQEEAVSGENIFFLPTSDLSPGAHTVSMRCRDTAGNWSTTTVSPLYVTEKYEEIVRYEYFVDTDPGEGNATGVAVNDSGESSFIIPTKDLSVGTHNFVFRGCDASGKWQTIYAAPFEVTTPSGINDVTWKMAFTVRREAETLILTSENVDAGSIVEIVTLNGISQVKTKWENPEQPLSLSFNPSMGNLIIVITSPSGERTVKKIH